MLIRFIFLITFFIFFFFIPVVNPLFRINPWSNIFGLLVGGSLVFLFLLVGFFLAIIFFGNFFCGYVCPLGNINYFSHRIFRLPRLKINLGKKTRYILLVAILLPLIISLPLLYLFEPMSILTRAMRLQLIPLLIFITIILLGLFSHRFWCQICPLGSIISLMLTLRPRGSDRFDPLRRTLVVSLVALPFLKFRLLKGKPLRPPGSIDESLFSVGCIRCWECVKVCPTGVIQPAGLEFGLGRLWTPKLVFRPNACIFLQGCDRCGRVCPSGVIDRKKMPFSKIGLARIDKSRCLVWGRGVGCLICKEVCPINAIYTDELMRPRVSDLCRGCGMCEARCPVEPSAIRVFSL